MIDERGYRANVGIVIANDQGQLLWAKRAHGQDSWQFPQGGIQKNETPLVALWRELYEELGLTEEHASVIAESQHWYHYDLPEKYVRRHQLPLCIGQKQRWFLLKLEAEDSCIDFNCFDAPEFQSFQWVDYWHPIDHIIDFKREVYQKVLNEFASFLNFR